MKFGWVAIESYMSLFLKCSTNTEQSDSCSRAGPQTDGVYSCEAIGYQFIEGGERKVKGGFRAFPLPMSSFHLKTKPPYVNCCEIICEQLHVTGCCSPLAILYCRLTCPVAACRVD